MIPTSSYLSNIPNQAIYDHQFWNHMKKCYLMIPTSSYLSNIPNQAIYDHQIWNHMEKCYLMIPISSHLNNLPNQVIFRVIWPSDLKLHEKMLPNDTHIIPFEQPTQSGNIQNHVTIRYHMKKCCLMMHISSHLSNLPNQIIFRVMWPSDLKSHEKMLLNDTHIILFEQPSKSGNIQSHVLSDLKLHEKMLPNDTHIILFEQPTQSSNIQSHVTTTLYICTTISL